MCPLHLGEQPRVTPFARFVMELYYRTQAYGALPDEGGLLQQDERLMRLLDVVHEEVQAARRVPKPILPGGQ